MRRRSVLKFLKRAGIALIGLCVVFSIAAVIFATRCATAQRQLKVQSEASKQRAKLAAGIKDYARAEESTYLGYPEWFIVWSYTEKADFQQQDLPSGFPFWKSIQQ